MLVTPTRLFTPFASLSGAAESSVEGWSLYFHSPRKRVSLGLLSAVRFETGVFTSTACTLCGRAASFSRHVSSSSLLRFRVVVSVDRRRSARDRDREKGTGFHRPLPAHPSASILLSAVHFITVQASPFCGAQTQGRVLAVLQAWMHPGGATTLLAREALGRVRNFRARILASRSKKRDRSFDNPHGYAAALLTTSVIRAFAFCIVPHSKRGKGC